VNEAYWAKHPHGPFATLIAVAATYCHPEAYDGGYTDLIDRARSAEPDDEEIRAFKAELREALADPGRLPDDELFKASRRSTMATGATRGFCGGCGAICTGRSRSRMLEPGVATARNRMSAAS
jgi:hypothetical protein